MTQLTLLGDPPAGSSERAEELSQWFTSRQMAETFVAWALRDHSQGDIVLEPSAGSGVLVDEIINTHKMDCVAVEFDRHWIERLERLGPMDVIHDNFLALKPPPEFDAVVMNPPYENDQDLTHIVHALGFSKNVYALVRTVFLHGKDRYRRLWSKVHLKRMGLFIGRPSFRLGGEKSDGARHDFCAIHLTHAGWDNETEVEWL